ncbi:uncharacterized protein LOC119481567 isoform X1 [Sebastes umbrosus]|uniref:uncharacterized protein LOC119481567 isoform X1 n=1 Tax=Sebastes umbrosus TaxID=72105 RepID=UPI00189C8CAA|nr:uncharacterized protein LOC119481567 isoform X1 [Sebastes umbrosus]
MRSFTLITALLLCSLSSVSGSESQTVKVQSGDEVTLTCNNISSGQTQTDWFRVINRTKPSCISSMYWFDDEASFCVGFQNRFEMSSNISTVFLKIKRVDFSDSGLYFCGFYVAPHTVIADATHLIVQGDGESDGEVDLKTESWISVSGSESQTVEVQSGEEVTLTCFNMSSYGSMTSWVRLVDRTKASCITVMFDAKSDVKYCDGVQNLKFEMSSNISTLFLKIKHVDLSDSGQYFCGFYSNGRPTFSVIRLNVEEKGSNEIHDDVDSQCEMSDGTAKLTSMILGGLTGFLVAVIIGLVVKVRKLQTAASEDQNSQQYENVDCDELRDAELSLYSTVRNRRPTSEREVETRVVYAASR